MDFPSAPTNGQVFTSGGVAYTWNGYAWIGGAIPAAGADAPSDGNEYVRVNGAWRMVKQTIVPAVGNAPVDVAVPSWATMVDMYGHVFVSGADVTGLRVSYDGTTFLAGGTDYNNGGPNHVLKSPGTFNSQGATYSNYLWLTPLGDNVLVPIIFRGTMNVAKPVAGAQFAMKVFAEAYNATDEYKTQWFHGAPAVGTALRLAALRFFSSFGAGSQIHLRWL